MAPERITVSDSLFDLDPGPWSQDPETGLWATFDGRVAQAGYLNVGERMWHPRGQFWGTRQVWKPAYWPTINVNPKGYMRLAMRPLVHRVVARAWVSNPNGKPQVHHIDHNKHNNSVDNLQWVTNSENIQAAYDFGLMTNRPRNNRGQFS